MYGGMNPSDTLNINHLLAVVAQIIFSNKYREYLDSLTPDNFIALIIYYIKINI